MSAINPNNNAREFVWKINPKTSKANQDEREAKIANEQTPDNEASATEQEQTIPSEKGQTDANMMAMFEQALQNFAAPMMEKMSKLEQNIKVLRAENAILHEMLKELLEQQILQYSEDEFLHNL